MKRPPVISPVLACVCLCLPACEALQLTSEALNLTDPKPKNRAADAWAVVPQEFLFSRYQPLNAWLDQAVRVQIMDIPLMNVFDHQTLRGLRYVWVKVPPSNPLVTIDKLAMTRRQLLWSLSHDHQLHMTPSFGPNGEVTGIEIRSRIVDLPESYK